eukprot:2120042-Prymnesium_polylepis.2
MAPLFLLFFGFARVVEGARFWSLLRPHTAQYTFSLEPRQRFLSDCVYLLRPPFRFIQFISDWDTEGNAPL